jgi:PIN domain nuclease of toxin-antitoxin system
MGARKLIVLDTHILVWMILDAGRMPPKILSAISAENVLGVPAISLWEIAMLARKGRIRLPETVLFWLQRALAQPKIRLIPINAEIAARSASLSIHGDPADRLIAASALVLRCPLATVDGNLLSMPELQTVT